MEAVWQNLKEKGLKLSGSTTKNYERTKRKAGFLRTMLRKTSNIIAILGWVALLIFLLDAWFNKGSLTTWLLLPY